LRSTRPWVLHLDQLYRNQHVFAICPLQLTKANAAKLRIIQRNTVIDFGNPARSVSYCALRWLLSPPPYLIIFGKTWATARQSHRPTQIVSIRTQNRFSSVPATVYLGGPSRSLSSRRKATQTGIARISVNGKTYRVYLVLDPRLRIQDQKLLSDIAQINLPVYLGSRY
jgi:hypothetical protein